MANLLKLLYSVQLVIFACIHLRPVSSVRSTHISEGIKPRYELLLANGPLQTSYNFSRYVVSIRTVRHIKFWGDNHFCAGVIITSKTVMTAAHCVMDKYKVVVRASRLRLVVGTPNRLSVPKEQFILKVSRIQTHHEYVRERCHDIAILIVKGAMPHYQDAVQFIEIAQTEPAENSKCEVLGWGQIYPYGPYANELFYVDVIIAPESMCVDSLKHYTKKGQICAVGDAHDTDVCPGDTGGPLICNEQLVGIAAGTSMCTGKRPMKFSSVPYYRKWRRTVLSRAPAPMKLLHNLVACKLCLILFNYAIFC